MPGSRTLLEPWFCSVPEEEVWLIFFGHAERSQIARFPRDPIGVSYQSLAVIDRLMIHPRNLLTVGALSLLEGMRAITDMILDSSTDS